MALYSNIAGKRLGSWLTDQLYNGGSQSTQLRLDPTTGDIVAFDPGVVLPTSPSEPLPVDQGTIIKQGDTQPTVIFDPGVATPTTSTNATVPTPLPASTTPTTQTTPAPAQTKTNYLPLALLGGLILLSVSSDGFMRRGKRVLFVGGIGLWYYLSTRNKVTA